MDGLCLKIAQLRVAQVGLLTLAAWLAGSEPTEKKKQKKNGISKYFGLTLTRVTLRPDPSGQVVA